MASSLGGQVRALRASTPALIAVLRWQPLGYETRNGPYVFTNKKGGPRGYMSQAIRKAIKHAGLHDCRIHTLRHTHASRLIQNGLSVYEVREVLGHTDIKTTMRYAHLEASKVTSKARDVINRLNQQGQESQSHF